jgi:hypothetical protein
LARPDVALSASPVPWWGRPSNRSSGRPMSRRPVSRRPLQSGVRTDRTPVSAALPPRCPRRAGPGVARCGGPPSGWAQWVDVPPWSAGGVVACRHRAGRQGMVRRWPCWLTRGSTLAQGCRLAGVPAAASPDRRTDTALVRGGCRPGGGGARDGAGAHRPPQGVLGRSSAWCPTMGLDQEVVTTLRGRWARVGPCRPAPEDPPGSVGSSLRPQRGRGA